MLEIDYEIFHYYDSYVREVKLHHHDFYEIYCLLNGEATYAIDGRQYVLSRGDILLINPNELHQVNLPEDGKPYERMVLWISRSHLEELSSDNTELMRMFSLAYKSKSNLLRLSVIDSQRIIALLEELSAISTSCAYGDDLMRRSKIVELLVLLNRYYSGNVKLKPTVESENDAIIEYIAENLTDRNLSLDSISAAMFISPSRLAHKFKETIGTSVYQYIIKRRLILAKELLRNGTTVVAIYSACGFKDYTGFFRTFKQEYGMTPKEYARAVR